MTQQHVCSPCSNLELPLSSEEIQTTLKTLSKWNLKKDPTRITRTIIFKNFIRAMGFVTKLADLAEQENHHPDFCVHDYKKVTITLYTHKTQNIHRNDAVLAQKIDALLKKPAKSLSQVVANVDNPKKQ